MYAGGLKSTKSIARRGKKNDNGVIFLPDDDDVKQDENSAKNKPSIPPLGPYGVDVPVVPPSDEPVNPINAIGDPTYPILYIQNHRIANNEIILRFRFYTGNFDFTTAVQLIRQLADGVNGGTGRVPHVSGWYTNWRIADIFSGQGNGFPWYSQQYPFNSKFEFYYQAWSAGGIEYPLSLLTHPNSNYVLPTSMTLNTLLAFNRENLRHDRSSEYSFNIPVGTVIRPTSFPTPNANVVVSRGPLRKFGGRIRVSWAVTGSSSTDYTSHLWEWVGPRPSTDPKWDLTARPIDFTIDDAEVAQEGSFFLKLTVFNSGISNSNTASVQMFNEPPEFTGPGTVFWRTLNVPVGQISWNWNHFVDDDQQSAETSVYAYWEDQQNNPFTRTGFSGYNLGSPNYGFGSVLGPKRVLPQKVFTGPRVTGFDYCVFVAIDQFGETAQTIAYINFDEAP